MILETLAFICMAPAVVDGDTIRCADLGRVRLAAIDAPELGKCRVGRICAPGDPHASKAALTRMVAAGPVHCTSTGRDRYRRILARCSVNGRDLGQAMLDGGWAVKWPIRRGGR